MSDMIQWGVLGNANIARVCVIPAIQKSNNGRVRALATRSPGDAQTVLSKNRITRVYGDYDALLGDPDIDAVYIPLPNHLHRPWTLKALQAGKHVLCEKPLACNAGEAAEMADAAEASGRLLMEAFMYRFHPRSRRIRQMVADAMIGRLRLIRSAFCYAMAEDQLDDAGNARMRPDMGGGALLDVGCYGVSLARWMMGSEPTAVQAQAIYHRSGVDVHVVASLRFPGAGLAGIEASFISALQQTYTVVGTGGALELPHDAFIPWEKDAVFSLRLKDQENGRQFVTAGDDEYRLMIEHFGDAIAGQCHLSYSPSESVANMTVLDALAAAARNGTTVKVE
jgi:predicted dehydrogenase